MPWFSASVILYTRFKDGRQDFFPAWENVYLIEAPTRQEARKKPARLGRESAGDFSGSYTFQGRPASLVFAGIRKIISCVDSKRRPKDGTEIAYSRLRLQTKIELKKLIAGDPVKILCEE